MQFEELRFSEVDVSDVTEVEAAVGNAIRRILQSYQSWEDPEFIREAARAAIEAMMTPTEEMISAASNQEPKEPSSSVINRRWKAMILAALSPRNCVDVETDEELASWSGWETFRN